MKYLIAIDSDGTLKNSKGEITDYTKNVINQISQENIVVVATARPRYHTLKVAKEINCCDYLISSNGTEVYDGINNSIIWATYIEPNICKDLYNYATKNDVRIIFVLENKEYVTKFVRNKNQVLITSDNIEVLLGSNIKQIMVIDRDKNKIGQFQNLIINKYHLNVVDSSNKNKEEIWFSIISEKASKGNALQKLAEYLKIDMKQTIAIGNDNNDISMIEKANIGVAMKNGSKELLNSSDVITESNDNDGVAKFLEKIL